MSANDWYDAHKPDITAALKRGKTAPKDHAVACTLVRMKDGAHLICAAVNASKATAMVREARSAGGKIVSAGQLFLDGDQIVFEVSEGNLPPKAKWTEGGIAAGVPLANVLIRPAPGASVGADTEGQGVESEEAPHEGTAALKETLSRLVPSVQQAVKDHPERKHDLLQMIAQCKQQIDNGHAAEAKTSLKDIVGFLKELGPSGHPPTPPPPPDGSTSARDAFMTRAKALKAAIDQIQATDHGRAAVLSKMLVDAAGTAKANGFEAAQATLDAVEAKLATPQPPPPPSDLPAFMARAKGLKAALDQLQATDPSRAAELSKLLVKAAASAKAKAFAAAQATLDQVEAALATSPGEEPQTPAAQWEAERTPLMAKLQDEIKVVLAIQDPHASGAELELKAVLKQLAGKMETQQQAIEMERYLLEDEVVADVCELAFDLKTPLLKVLREIRPQLTA